MTAEERNELAAEYALGVLDGGPLGEARSLHAADAGFAAEVAAWRGRLAPLLDEFELVSPPARVWAAIEQRIAGRGGANDNDPDLRRSRNLWRAFAAGASALAASLALVILVEPASVYPDRGEFNRIEPDPVEQEPVAAAPAGDPMVAMMEAEDSDTRLVATWDPGDRSLVVAAAAGLAPLTGQSHQLWVIPADGTPRSMGVLPGTDPVHVRVAPALAAELAEGATLALSVEPSGGSPTGLPTGPVIAAGMLQGT